MPSKRKDDPESALDEVSGREKKKQKISSARIIAVQPAKMTNALGSTALPSAIGVEQFAEARAFEIDAMHSAMKNASASTTSRAWQTLPRHLRRRAASHDVRRVPLRLRDKARAEMDPIKKKAHGLLTRNLGKSKRIKRTEMFAKRQRDKVWLETHIWHAKRMKMENMWGYRLPVHPTEKSYRPSHRASILGSILHDASYYALIELTGPETVLKKILERCCDPHGPSSGSKRFITGTRAQVTYIYEYGSYPFGLISPIMILWKPLLSMDSVGPSVDQNASVDKPASRRKRNSKDKACERGTEQDLVNNRVVWLRTHPSTFEDVFTSLQSSTSAVLDDIKDLNDGNECIVEIADLRGQVSVFEIMGPKTNQVLAGALSPVDEDRRDDFKKFWLRLANMQSSGELSRGTIVGFRVIDPRLKFPPKNAKIEASTSGNVAATFIFPSAQLAQCEIWNKETRERLSKPRYKKKDLDGRRSKLLIPGSSLRAERQDDRIPVLLVQRSLEVPDSNNQGIHGWNLIIPSGWSMAFFSSLTYTGTRVGGQRERQTQAFEAGTIYFPRDLPTSSGYEAYAAAREMEEKNRWERKPPAKRPNYEKLGTPSPWKADWETILGIPRPNGSADKIDVVGNEGDIVVPTQRDPSDIASLRITSNGRMWLLRGTEASSIVTNVSKLFNSGAGLLQEINRLRKKQGHEQLDFSVNAESLMKGALVSIRVRMCRRGAPEDLAMIYTMSDQEARRWEKVLRSNKGISDDVGTPDEVQLSNISPPSTDIVGFLTTGHFSLLQGHGCGIGAIPLFKLLQLEEQKQRLRPGNTSRLFLVKVRNRNSQQCRAAYLEIIDV